MADPLKTLLATMRKNEADANDKLIGKAMAEHCDGRMIRALNAIKAERSTLVKQARRFKKDGTFVEVQDINSAMDRIVGALIGD